MPKKFLQKHLPKPEVLAQYRGLHWLGSLLHRGELWHLTRHSTARACGLGLFCAFMPIPFQMVLSALLALGFRANLPASVSLVWVTNPLTIAPFFYFCYRVGIIVLGEPAYPKLASLSLPNIGIQMTHLWQPLVVGSLIVGSTVGLAGFWLVHLLWSGWVKYRWYKRRFPES